MSVPLIRIATLIHAPRELCFDLARDIQLHIRSTTGTREQAVGDVTSGLLGPGQEVTWKATHFGVRQRLTSRITIFDRPAHFRDSQVQGAFRSFDHDHFFHVQASGTLMEDVFRFESPLGWLGRCADHLFLEAYLTRFLANRAEVIRRTAEGAFHE